MAKWTLKALSVISGLAVASLTAAMDIDLGFAEYGTQVELDLLGRPIIVGRTENPTSSIFAAAFRLNGTNLWTTTVTSSDPLGAISRKPVVRLGKLIIPWRGAGSYTYNVGSIEINSTTGSLVSQSMSTDTIAAAYNGSSVSANGTVYQYGNFIEGTSPNFVSAKLFQKTPTGAGSFSYFPGAANSFNIMFDGVATYPGGVFVLGHITNTGTSDCYAFVTKYDPTTLAEIWTTEIHGPNNYIFPRGIAVDSGGNIFVGGHERTIFGDIDLVYAKLNPSGTLVARRTLISPTTEEVSLAFTLSPSGIPAIAAGYDGKLLASTASSDLANVYGVVNPAETPATCVAADSSTFYFACNNHVMRVDALCVPAWFIDYSSLGTIYGLASNGTSVFAAGTLGSNAQLSRIDVVTGNLIW